MRENARKRYGPGVEEKVEKRSRNPNACEVMGEKKMQLQEMNTLYMPLPKSIGGSRRER